MRFNQKITKNSKILSIALLLSLINILFPQTAVSQIKINGSETTQEIHLADIKNDGLDLDKKDFKYLPIANDKKPKKNFYITVTAYSSTPDQTDGDPFTTASGEKVRDGIIAYNYLPFGTRIRFPEIYPDKIFVVKDRLHPRAGRYLADIWMPTRQEALKWGAKVIKIEIF